MRRCAWRVSEARLRANVNAMFVNLSRRSQTLVERQITLIDGLERGEQDEQRLGDLFKLDHLATRMRRNSENLLVLAGQDAARRWSQPVKLVDVVRASLSEVESYDRVSSRSVGVGDRGPGRQRRRPPAGRAGRERARRSPPSDTRVIISEQPHRRRRADARRSPTTASA